MDPDQDSYLKCPKIFWMDSMTQEGGILSKSNHSPDCPTESQKLIFQPGINKCVNCKLLWTSLNSLEDTTYMNNILFSFMW